MPAASEITKEIQRHIEDSGRGEALREGVRLAIVGPPNAGKSSLINAFARRDIAIVSETPGTTRDVIGVRLDLGGYPVQVSDTAGLRDTKDAIEAEGVRRARLAEAARQPSHFVAAGRQPEAETPAIKGADLVVRNKKPICRASRKTANALVAIAENRRRAE